MKLEINQGYTTMQGQPIIKNHQGRQCAHNVTLRNVRVTIVAVEKQ
jgi:hypothetical protein